MRKDKHAEILNEVLDEIETALKDKRGLIAHQRRLAFSLSLGVANLIEIYFHELDIIKEGAKINHLWFKKKKENVMGQLQKQMTSPVSSVKNINKIIDIAIKTEEKRDDLAYGAPSTEKILQEKISMFFELKEIIKC